LEKCVPEGGRDGRNLGVGNYLSSGDGVCRDILGVDVQDYIVLYQGGNSGSQLSINILAPLAIWTGDIGIAGAENSPQRARTLDGDINFAAPDTGQASISNTTINGTVITASPRFQAIMNNLNNVSSHVGRTRQERATAVRISTQTCKRLVGRMTRIASRVLEKI